MAYTSLPTVVPGEATRASWGNLVDANLDDHETRISDLEAGGGTGDVVGPASATDHAIPRFDLATGKLLQDSPITIADAAVAGTLSGTNSGDVSLTGAPNYLTIVGQVITRALINLASHVTGRLPFANLAAATGASRLLGRGSGSGAGDFHELLLGSGLEMTGNTLNATGGAGSGAPTNATYVALSTDPTLTNERVLAAGTGIALVDNGAGGTVEIHATPQTGAQNTYLVTGGQIVWQSDYTFDVSAANFFINGALYSSAEDTVVLSAAHATLDRIDTIAVDDSGAVVVLEGTAAAQPVEPDVDPGTQLKLGFVLVTAASSEPPTVTDTPLYLENAGDPAEWDWTTSGSGFTLNSTTNPRTGTTDIEGTAVANGAYAQGDIGSGTIDPNDYTLLVLYLRSKATWNNNRGLSVSFRLNGAQVGSAVTIQRSGTWGFSSSNTSDYQLVAIPITAFAIASGATTNQIRIADFGGSIGFYIDDIALQGGGSTQQPVAGLTQEQADARYRQLSVAVPAADLSGTVPTARLGTGTADNTTFLRGDQTWGTPAGGSGLWTDDSGSAQYAGQYYSPEHDAGTSGTSKTIDWNDGNTQLLELTGNVTLTLSNPKSGGRYLIALEQDGSGSRTVTWPSSVKWSAGTAPTLSTAAGAVDVVTLVFISGLGASGNYLAAANTDYTPA